MVREIKLGLVVFANNSGLGNQTRRLAEMLKPFRLLAIDSRGFSKNKKQHFQWYDNLTGYRVQGFPKHAECRTFLKGLTHLLLCENPLNFSLISLAREMGVKTFIQSNYEFCDNISNTSLPLPDYFLMPSSWKLPVMQSVFKDKANVMYLPPPIDPNEFKRAREENLKPSTGKIKFLHVVGTLATQDRNGTLDILNALPYCKSDFTLTITSQHPLPPEYIVSDPRIRYSIDDVEEVQDLYIGHDALILPRRYGGLSLTCNEALMSGLPVLMTDISPNNTLLPPNWLVNASQLSQFKARDIIDVYSTHPLDMAFAMSEFCAIHDKSPEVFAAMKLQAFEIAHNEFSPSKLQPIYESLWS